MEFSKNLTSIIASYPTHSGFLIAYSGGADSTALLHLLHQQQNVRAIHINHGLQQNANVWQQHCQQTCDKLSIELIVEQAQLTDTSENSSRQVRYGFFRKHLRQDEILLTAHHSQDQAETILLKLLRGTGIKGLGGIAAIRVFAQGYIARPLLDSSVDDLTQYLMQQKIQWIEDTSNQDNSYKRNFIRNQIIPQLHKEFPQVVDNMARSATNTTQSLQLLNHLIGFADPQLEIKQLKSLPQELQATLLYHWLANKNLPTPDKPALAQLSKDFIAANQDKQPHYRNKYYQLFRWQDAIYCIENYEKVPTDISYKWHPKKEFILPNNFGKLICKQKDGELTIKFNQRGQKLTTHKHNMNKTVKQLFQENNIPLWHRHNTPFIYHNNNLISLGYSWSTTKEFKDSISYQMRNFIL
ncbi:MAG: tRNA lysidine(34) synthetase TilS [Proteobacteria bacterium]|nr:tRNA lysidine(34) synthetase TilS [Pseudomonadota bacterium]